jgi:hypothetical protein
MKNDKTGIIIFDIFLNSDLRIEVFKETLKSAKKLGLPIMVISNFKVPDYLIDQFDYFIYSKDNILFTDSYDRYPFVQFYMDHQFIKYENNTKCYQKHGLSVLSNLKTTSKFAENLGYKKFIRIEWDFIISDEDINNINDIINNFIDNDKRAYFLYNSSNGSGLPNIAYHFWMVDLKFWNENFPDLHDEQQYKQYILHKNKENFFEIAERILFLCFENKLTHDEIISENDFVDLFKKSQINKVINDINFDLPSDNGCCRGLVKILRKEQEDEEFKLTGELGLFTWNRIKKECDHNIYEIKFENTNHVENHSANFDCWSYSVIPNFNTSQFPITLKVNKNFEKTYYSIDEINSLLVVK